MKEDSLDELAAAFDDQQKHPMGLPWAKTRYFRCSPTGCT